MDAQEEVARTAVLEAGRIIRDQWLRRGAVSLKSNAIDLVTDTDRAAETAILELLRSRFPDYSILAEESGERGAHEYRWLVDPLDGTTNFAHTYPQVSVSIALLRAGRPVLGVVYDPLRGELFVGRRGEGASLNEEPLRSSASETLSASLLLTGFPYDRREQADYYLSFFKAFMMRTHGIRRAGSAALDLCWVAAGRADGFWEWKLKPWDTAAGALIVQEARGRTTDFRGGEFDPFGPQCLATNGRIHEEMLSVIRGLLRPEDR